RPDGLSVLNIQQIDERIGLATNFISNYEPKDIMLVCRRENGWKAIKLVEKITGIKAFAGRYPPGILTNPNLDKYTEAKLILVADPWPDKNAVNDAIKIGIPVIGCCDTNNQVNNLDLVIPCNNKGKKSLGILLYLIAKNYSINKGIIKNEEEMKHSLEEFTED
ncbi:MAG: 30S ribosomal protein S2, partial [Nanoarchaeota archaeon]|nr:30S ribosomal protein S2 [Nanoarchaeota archaeon]